MENKTDNFADEFDKELSDLSVVLLETKKAAKPKTDISRVDESIFDFYKEFGIEYEPSSGMALTGQYYGFLGLREYFVRYGYKGRQFTRVFAESLQKAKDNLTCLQKAELFAIERVN